MRLHELGTLCGTGAGLLVTDSNQRRCVGSVLLCPSGLRQPRVVAGAFSGFSPCISVALSKPVRRPHRAVAGAFSGSLVEVQLVEPNCEALR